jgi:cytochrome c oxidase assembly protein subunit 15
MNWKKDTSPVAIWLMIGVGMIMIQVVLGGITRLTGSGLSITEWKPLLGAIPPLTEADWMLAFEKYKQIGQYKHINFDFTLSDFKFIYFWEWFHREWARLMGLVFAIGFVIFLIRKKFNKAMILPMVLLFILGGLQGAIGWIMVKSGLNEENLYVNHIRLAIHFISALGLLCYVFWFASDLLVKETQRVNFPFIKRLTITIAVVLVIQLVYGAFMAGLKAATAATTWPTINGMWIPDTLGSKQGDLINNPISVQFIHRTIAYLLVVLIVFWWILVSKKNGSLLFEATKIYPGLLIIVQLILGIFTVLNAANAHLLLYLGVAHQFVAMVLLLSIVWHLFLLRKLSNTDLN